MEEPRGIRNCNPGNIRITKDYWKGLRPLQDDEDFYQFTSIEWGYRAMFKILQTYRKKYGCKSVADMIARYAPPSENNTDRYIQVVCEKMGKEPSFIPIVENKRDMCMLVAAMSYMENGVLADMEDVAKGWELL